MYRWLVLGLFLGCSALAQTSPEPLAGRVTDAVRTWSEAEILSEFGQMKKSGEGRGGQLTRQLPKAGRYVKWGGGLAVGGLLVYEALNWFYNSAQASLDPALDSWWNQSSTGFVEPINQTGSFHWVVDLTRACRGYVGTNRTVGYTYWMAGGYDRTTNKHAGVYIIFKGTYSQGNSNIVAHMSYTSDANAVLAAHEQACKTLNLPVAQTLSSAAPNSGRAVKDVIARYLEANPSKIPTMLTPLPNINELSDDVLDPGLDTDKDGVTDGDELRRGPGVVTNPGNRPHIEDGLETDPSDSTSVPVDIDGDAIPDWRDGDDDNDGVEDEDEAPDGQKDATKKPDAFVDTDGDGLTDDVDTDDDNDGATDVEEEAAGTNSKDATSKPKEEVEEEPKDEVTCKEKGGTWQNEQCSLPEKLPDQSELAQPEAFKLPDLSKLKDNFNKNAEKLIDSADEKLPFGIAAKWFPRPSTVGSDCPSWPMKIGVLDMVYKPCDTQVARDAHNIMRPVLLGIMMLGFGFAAARIVGGS